MTSPSKPTGLLEALLVVQAEAPTLKKDKSNPAFKGSKYVSLDAIVEQIGPLLNRCGLIWVTLPTTNEHGQPALTYRLVHAETKDAIEGTIPLLLSKSDPQSLGSALTYARRQSLCAVLNLVADDDDDGNAAAQARQGERAPARGNGKPAESDSVPPEPLLTPAQLARFNDRLDKSGIPPQRVDIIYAAAGVSDRQKVSVSQAKRLSQELDAEIARQAAREAMAGHD